MNQDIANRPPWALDRCFPQTTSNPAGRARLATSALFLVDGMTFGTWAALIPSFQQRFALSAGQLSAVLFGLVLGALVAMPLAGRLIARWGSRRVVFPAALGFTGTLPLLALAPAPGWLIAAAVLFGAWKGALDVSVNSQGITVENAVGKPIISSFQGFWSLGGLSAAFLLSLAMHQGFAPSGLMIGMAVLLFAVVLSTFGSLLPDAASQAVGRRVAFALPSGRLLRLGALAFLALFSEGVLLDWSAVYARTIADVPVAVAPMAFAVFALCMAGGRFLGDVLIARMGPIATLRASGVLMAAGIAVAVFVPEWPAVFAGFALVGFGVANLVPVIFGAAGRVDERGAGPGLATVSTLGYFGFLSGPPVIGLVAAAAGLPVAFASVILFGAIIATLGVAAVSPARNSLTKEDQ
jgi:MFS family permease